MGSGQIASKNYTGIIFRHITRNTHLGERQSSFGNTRRSSTVRRPLNVGLSRGGRTLHSGGMILNWVASFNSTLRLIHRHLGSVNEGAQWSLDTNLTCWLNWCDGHIHWLTTVSEPYSSHRPLESKHTDAVCHGIKHSSGSAQHVI